jgi:hypothetical protein
MKKKILSMDLLKDKLIQGRYLIPLHMIQGTNVHPENTWVSICFKELSAFFSADFQFRGDVEITPTGIWLTMKPNHKMDDADIMSAISLRVRLIHDYNLALTRKKFELIITDNDLSDFELFIRLNDCIRRRVDGTYFIPLNSIRGDDSFCDDSQWLSICSYQFSELFSGENAVQLDSLGLRINLENEGGINDDGIKAAISLKAMLVREYNLALTDEGYDLIFIQDDISGFNTFISNNVLEINRFNS